MKRNRIFGIDLGTTYSCIAYVDEHSKPVVVPNAENSTTTPSVVYFESPENFVVGQTAKDVAHIYSDRCISMVKRSMGKPNVIFPVYGHNYTPQDVSSFILRQLVKDAEQALNEKITDVVITCPAYFGTNERMATKQAGELAGLNVRYVIPEPTAAAFAYGMDQNSEGVFLVYDLGGGTFDVTLVEVKAGMVRVLATGGDHELGGKDWDEAIVSYFCSAFENETGTPATNLKSDEETFQTLLNAAEKAKKALSAKQKHDERVQFDTNKVTVTLTREKFVEITAGLLERTISLTEEMLARAADQGHTRVDRLLLVGGSTYMPQVKDALAQRFPYEIQQYDPNLAVAKGAALFGVKCEIEDAFALRIAAGMNAGEATREIAAEHGLAIGSVRRLNEIKVINVSSKSFGLVVVDSQRDLEVVNNLIHLDEPIPKTMTRTFGTYADRSTEVELRCMENLARPDAGNTVDLTICTEVGMAVLEFGRPMPKGTPIEITFDMAADGLLRLHGRELQTGREIEAKFKTEGVMPVEEVEAARRRNLAIQVGA